MKPDKAELWEKARLIVGALKALNDVDTSKFSDTEWGEIEEEWFDWLKDTIEGYEASLKEKEIRGHRMIADLEHQKTVLKAEIEQLKLYKKRREENDAEDMSYHGKS
jgi:hypothetical protein